jgi:hypothetical protein
MKNAVFWDVAPCRPSVNRRFGGTYRLHLQGRKIRERGTSVSRWLQTAPADAGSSLADFSTLKMEAIRSSLCVCVFSCASASVAACTWLKLWGGSPFIKSSIKLLKRKLA